MASFILWQMMEEVPPEIWATDGTEAGTYLVKDIVSSGGSSQPNNLIAFNGALYFTASSSTNAIPD